MTIYRKGIHVELVNRSTNRVIFSASTDELEKKTFDELWKVIGDNIYNANVPEHINYYELRVSPLN